MDAALGLKRARNLQDFAALDVSSISAPLWMAPSDAGYSYSSPSPHIASNVVHSVTGLDLQDWIQAKLAAPMGFGEWDYCRRMSDGSGRRALDA